MNWKSRDGKLFGLIEDDRLTLSVESQAKLARENLERIRQGKKYEDSAIGRHQYVEASAIQ